MQLVCRSAGMFAAESETDKELMRLEGLFVFRTNFGLTCPGTLHEND